MKMWTRIFNLNLELKFNSDTFDCLNLNFGLKFRIKTLELNILFFPIFDHAPDVLTYSSGEYTQL